MLDIKRLVLRRDRFLDRNDVHSDPRATGRHHLCKSGQRFIRHAFEEVCRLREHIAVLRIDHHQLRGSGNKDVEHPALLMVRVFAVIVFVVVLEKT